MTLNAHIKPIVFPKQCKTKLKKANKKENHAMQEQAKTIPWSSRKIQHSTISSKETSLCQDNSLLFKNTKSSCWHLDNSVTFDKKQRCFKTIDKANQRTPNNSWNIPKQKATTHPCKTYHHHAWNRQWQINLNSARQSDNSLCSNKELQIQILLNHRTNYTGTYNAHILIYTQLRETHANYTSIHSNLQVCAWQNSSLVESMHRKKSQNTSSKRHKTYENQHSTCTQLLTIKASARTTPSNLRMVPGEDFYRMRLRTRSTKSFSQISSSRNN